MPQAIFQKVNAATGRTVRFGGLPLPSGQGTLGYVNLNDWTSWYLQDIQKDSAQDVVLASLLWRGRSTFLGADFPPAVIRLSMEYREVSQPLGVALAQLSQAGRQYLSFDQATAVPVRYRGISNRSAVTLFPNIPRWAFDLEFAAEQQFFTDLGATNLPTVNVVNAPTAAPTGTAAAGGALTAGTYTLQYTYVTASGETAPSPASGNIVLSGGNLQVSVSAVTPLPSFATAVRWYFASGPTTGFTVQNSGGAFTLNTAGNGTPAPASTPATAFSVAYAGSVRAEPVWVLNVPGTNTGLITSVVLANTMSGESLTALFPGGLAPSTAYAITIDCGAFTVSDGAGVKYDMSGSFPMLHPPAGQANPFTVSAATSSGVASGLTLAGSWNSRWEL